MSGIGPAGFLSIAGVRLVSGTDPSFSRSGISVGDKCDEPVKTLVPSHLHECLVALAALEGVGMSEYVRDVLSEHVYGRMTHVRMRTRGLRREGREPPG